MIEELETIPKLNVIYFNSDHTNTPKCQGKLAEEIDLSWTIVSTWGEMSTALHESNDAILAVSIDMMSQAPVKSATEFMDALATITKFMPCHARLKIGVVIKKTTPRSVIKELQRTQCQGILLHVDDYSVAEVNQCMKALGSGIPYWPKHILDELPDEQPVSIYFRADADTYMTADMMQGLKKDAMCRVQFCSTWNQLGSALQKQPHQLVFYIGMLTRLDLTPTEIIESLRTRMQLSLVSVPIGVSIEPTTPMSVIKELKRAGIFGIVPSAVHWGTHETVAGLNAMARREQYWPKHILDQLPGAKKIVANVDNVTLTARQEQVFRLIIERGASNKAIAKSIGISESTVKLHLTEIFKKYGVKNRTQLAVFSHVL